MSRHCRPPPYAWVVVAASRFLRRLALYRSPCFARLARVASLWQSLHQLLKPSRMLRFRRKSVAGLSCWQCVQRLLITSWILGLNPFRREVFDCQHQLERGSRCC